MSEIDEKLKNIVSALMFGNGDCSVLEDVELHARQIKQAFSDAGYISPEEVAQWQKTVTIDGKEFEVQILGRDVSYRDSVLLASLIPIVPVTEEKDYTFGRVCKSSRRRPS